ncbi:TetR/AcrR family transcriptional regulator [Enterococcus raffinosus]|uniref:TetR/AcrR family transcriptional regulator n=1 Tax=Enterococcus raffinosus TaxID=71452 RepID=UPI001C0F98C6|nr:TetR/AcrR family transcriptional regulator [Enterococcus raffinosus]MBU5363363.1 TetR/AcrR family transcriptional regulator [Enterococcus raffinosus]
MPRELTPDEKARNKQMLLDKGRALVYQYGIKKVSVDDVVASAGVAKGAFYHYFSSKDDFIYEIVYQIHRELFGGLKMIAERIKPLSSSERRKTIKVFSDQFFASKDMFFFVKEQQEVQNFLFRYSKEKMAELEAFEAQNYRDFFEILEIKDKQPEIVQNYVHVLGFGMFHQEVMIENYLTETIHIMLDGLMDYLEL